jgi:hypothetical protein
MFVFGGYKTSCEDNLNLKKFGGKQPRAQLLPEQKKKYRLHFMRKHNGIKNYLKLC